MVVEIRDYNNMADIQTVTFEDGTEKEVVKHDDGSVEVRRSTEDIKSGVIEEQFGDGLTVDDVMVDWDEYDLYAERKGNGVGSAVVRPEKLLDFAEHVSDLATDRVELVVSDELPVVGVTEFGEEVALCPLVRRGDATMGSHWGTRYRE